MLLAGGDFLSFLRTEGHHLKTKMLIKMAENVASGLAYLENKKCIHRWAVDKFSDIYPQDPRINAEKL